MSEAQKVIEDLKATVESLSEFKAEVETEREEQERKNMEAKGQYDKLSSKKDAEIAKLKKASEQAVIDSDKRLSDALIPTKIAALVKALGKPVHGETDLVDLLILHKDFSLDENGELISEHGDPGEVVAAFVEERPQNQGLEEKGEMKIKTGEATVKDRDIGKAMSDPAYAAEWKTADEGGYQKAVDEAFAS